jgi:membrane protease subunit HflK
MAVAEGEADRFTALLEEYEKAPEVTRERLYLDSLEQVLSSSTKIMIDVEGGNNLLYLPLDQLMKREEEDDE